jgi:hypothetical protein
MAIRTESGNTPIGPDDGVFESILVRGHSLMQLLGSKRSISLVIQMKRPSIYIYLHTRDIGRRYMSSNIVYYVYYTCKASGTLL